VEISSGRFREVKKEGKKKFALLQNIKLLSSPRKRISTELQQAFSGPTPNKQTNKKSEKREF